MTKTSILVDSFNFQHWSYNTNFSSLSFVSFFRHSQNPVVGWREEKEKKTLGSSQGKADHRPEKHPHLHHATCSLQVFFFFLSCFGLEDGGSVENGGVSGLGLGLGG